jgi:hypothetical protein
LERRNPVMDSLLQIFAAVAIGFILFFAYMTKNKLASYVAYTILASYALSMAFGGMIGMIHTIDFLSFLESFIRFLNDLVVFVEIGVILFLLFLSKFKTKIMILKVAIIAYVVIVLFLEFNVF